MMKTPVLAVILALLATALAMTAHGEIGSQTELQQPVPIERTTFEYDAYAAYQDGEAPTPTEAPPAPSPGDTPPEVPVDDSAVATDAVPVVPPEATEQEPVTPSTLTSGTACRSCRKSRCRCGCREPWKLPQPCFFKKRGIMIGGWLEQGITFNGNNPADGFNGPVGTNDLDGEYQMNQLWLYITKPTKTDGCGWDIGGHFDILFGSDWRFGINQGLEDRINGFNGQTYGTVIPQAYMEVAVNDLTVKLGHMAGILDYEVVPAVPNPFYSHSYCYAFTVPQLVTGVLADYKLTDQLSVQGGFTRGWMKFEDNNHHMDFMGGVKWVSSDKRTSLAYALNMGPQDDAGEHDRYSGSLVLQHQLTKKLRYVLVQNAGVEFGGADAGTRDAEWYGINQYFLYQLNPCWALNTRIEWLRDDDGTRVGGPPPQAGIRAWPLSGFAGNFYECSVGLRWTPRKNIIVRPELRWDWYEGETNAGGFLPFNDGNNKNQFLFGTDLIVTF